MITFDFTKTPITKVADTIIINGSKSGASDIHLDPRESGLMVRYRVDGDLLDYAFIPKLYERNLTTRLKLLANMNITETRLPQDGAIKGKFGDLSLDMRVSSLPTNEGEKIVIRILDYSRSLAGIDQLGFNPTNFEKLKRMISVPNGIILVTGATGSGKSTTVYSVLQVLNKEETNIITVEDPIEMNIEGMNQVQVNAEIGLTFATVLRSILRQDPNVILIGEIRDNETAQIAVRASITGHLVLSTIHTNNSLSTIERLLDMNVERYLLSTAFTGIISQRLAKTLCTECKQKRPTTPYEKKVFKLALDKDIEEIYTANPNGCNKCNKGYRGRIAVQEVLEINEDIRNTINNPKLQREALRKLVYGGKHVITMLQDGLEKIITGETSFEEIARIIEINNDLDDSYGKSIPKTKNTEELEKFFTQRKEDIEEIKNLYATENIHTKKEQNIEQQNTKKETVIATNATVANVQSTITSQNSSIIPNPNLVKMQQVISKVTPMNSHSNTSTPQTQNNIIPNPNLNKNKIAVTPVKQEEINPAQIITQPKTPQPTQTSTQIIQNPNQNIKPQPITPLTNSTTPQQSIIQPVSQNITEKPKVTVVPLTQTKQIIPTPQNTNNTIIKPTQTIPTINIDKKEPEIKPNITHNQPTKI